MKNKRLGQPYSIVNGKKVYKEKMTRQGAKPKLGENYKFVEKRTNFQQHFGN